MSAKIIAVDELATRALLRGNRPDPAQIHSNF
jgi:hypothetical protein